MKCININCNFVLIFLLICKSYTSNPFDDTILYNLKWPGRNPEKIADIVDPNNFEVGTTTLGERYFCFLPAEDKPKNEDSSYQYAGANPIQLLHPMFIQTTCSYRLESYWTYEVCHGKYVKQYHEERDGKKIKRQEYYLGKWDASLTDEINNGLKENLQANVPKTKKIEGMEIPFFQLNYTDGTLCDLNEKPRQTNVLYMCFDHSRHDIYSIKEISTCLYEAIIFTPLLCVHPLYKPKNSAEKDINCVPFEGMPDKPKKLLSMETDSVKQKHEQIIDDDQVLKKVFAVFSFDKSGNQVDLINFMEDQLDGEAQFRVQIHPIDSLSDITALPTAEPELPRRPDLNFDIPAFLTGKNCLEGGKGWWKYEFCYGKHVIQFHEEVDGSRTLIKLGEFSLEDHKAWLESNPLKKPKKRSTQVSHLYTRGSYCESNKNLRETEVRFKCIKESGSSPSAIKLYLVEPQTCKYVLYVESSLFCKLINDHMDQDGLFKEEVKEKSNVVEINETIEL